MGSVWKWQNRRPRGFSLNYVNDAFFTAAQNAASANAGLSTTNTANPNGLNGVPTLSSAPPVPIPPFGIPTTFSTNAANVGVANNAGYAIDPHLKPPYVEQWNLTIQRDLGHGTSLSIGYVGNHGVGLFRAIDVNQVVLGPNGFLSDFNRARADGFLAQSRASNAPGCTGPGTQNQCGFFNPVYQGPGSQTLTVFPAICGPGAFGAAGPTDNFGGVAFINTDIHQGFAGDLAHVYQEFGCGPTPVTYELPIGKGHRLLASENRLLGLLADGWQTGSIFTWQSGNPFSILSTQPTINRAGTRSSRNTAVATLSPSQIKADTGVFVQTNGTVYVVNPNLVGSNGTGAPPSNGLTCVPAVTGGFCNPQPGAAGNLSLDAFTGPTYFDWDLSASKDFHLTERFKLTFRTEAFNVLNHPVFFTGDQNINSTQFGQSTSTVSQARILQMSLRLKF